MSEPEPIPESNLLKNLTEELVLANPRKLRSVWTKNVQVRNFLVRVIYKNRNTLYHYNTDIIQNFNYVVVHCEWDDWVIGECNKECGGGMRTNTRTEKVSAEHGGEECPGPASVDESCNVHECPGYRMLRKIGSYH